MAFKHYDVVRAASPSDLAEKLTHKLKEGWQPFGSPVAITPYTLMQAIAAEGDVVVSGATEPEWYYVIVLAGQSNAMAYGEGLPLPDSYDAPHPRIKQLARRNTVTPGGEVCVFNDIIPADHCLHDVQDMSTINHPRADLSKGQYGCVGQGLHIAKKLLPYIPNNAGIQPKSIKETLEGVKDAAGNVVVHGIFASVPYCIQLLEGPYVET
ncbi:DUF1737 domain-containing protein, partial [Escherichia coli]